MAPVRKKILVDTHPTKRVVVESLTRDAPVRACIFDLIDNAVDAARAGAPMPLASQDLSASKISLTLSGTGCEIVDNCGGISANDLSSIVLRFGEPSTKAHGIGAFGVGLNRALFRLGKQSQVQTDNGREHSTVSLVNEQYLENKDWNLEATVARTSGQRGTKVSIQHPSTTIARDFSDAQWVDDLRREIGERYTRFIERGLGIEVNRQLAPASEIRIRRGGPYAGQHKVYPTELGVMIHVAYGQHEHHRFFGEPDYDLQRNLRLTKQYGWTVFCNDRAILIADQTAKTGWETKFHSEFYGFVGVVEFFAEDASLLPWNTTKSDVDISNGAYSSALVDMQHFSGEWRAFAERRKKGKEPLVIVPSQSPAAPPNGPAAAPPPRTTKQGKGALLPTATKKGTKAPPKQDHNQYGTVLPTDINVAKCFDKQLALVNSAMALDLSKHMYAGLALLRMLFEVGVVVYLDRQGRYADLVSSAVTSREKSLKRPLKAEEKRKLVPSFDEMTVFLQNDGTVWGQTKQNHLKHSLSRTSASQGLLNSAVHSPFQTTNVQQALIIRDEMLPVLRHLIEA